MEEKIYKVEVQADFMQKLARVAPVTGLAELIWNSLDADADSVEVTLRDQDLGREKLIIKDNGTGFVHADAPSLFRSLGNSWKRQKQVTGALRPWHLDG
jgi:DNA topoisomerase VI subunit B